ncbi:MAG: spore cortex biosynthesis protein YabQ [Syntrophomonadaceae bacterium]|nr:spore cortex biosynthesis protein YabQ [Syntrophomonadaceae bacterium]
MSTVLMQIQAFCGTLLLGIGAGLIFQYYQTVIRLARLRKYALYIVDLTLWIVMIAIIFAAMFFINGGEMRIYVLLALLIGMLIYYYKLSGKMQSLIGYTAEATVAIIIRIMKIINKPFLWLGKAVRKWLDEFKKPPMDEDEIIT